ncbi:MAG: glycosyltransferase family 4 protein [Patescibacteria group bacterium]
MKVLMFSMDKTLLGANESGGDAVKRHKVYGEFCDELNIIVFCKKGYQKQQLSDNVFVWPTNSLIRWNYLFNGYKIGKRIYKNSPFNLVIGDLFTALPAWFLKMKFKIKFLMHFHGDFWKNKHAMEKKFHNYFFLMLSKFLVRRADAIRVVSGGIKNKLVKAGIKKDKVHVIPTPADLSKFLTFDQTRVYELKQKHPNKNILFVGRLEKVKNLDWFLNIFKEIKKEYKDVNFLIAGEGSEKENLKLKAKGLKLEDSVKFLNKVNYDDLTNYYQLADIFVLPSLSESFGRVLVEAGASSTPCVSSATTGAKDVIQNKKTGFLVPINNQKQIIDKVVTLLKDKKLSIRMGDNAREFIKENFDGDIQTKKIIRLWQSLVFQD